MERKTTDFFDWDKVNMSKVMQQFSQQDYGLCNKESRTLYRV